MPFSIFKVSSSRGDQQTGQTIPESSPPPLPPPRKIGTHFGAMTGVPVSPGPVTNATNTASTTTASASNSPPPETGLRRPSGLLTDLRSRFGGRKSSGNTTATATATASGSASSSSREATATGPAQIVTLTSTPRRGNAGQGSSSPPLSPPPPQQSRRPKIFQRPGLGKAKASITTGNTATSPPASTTTSSPLASPRPNANKPLPSPPAPGSPLTQDPPPKPVLKLNRIMASLGDADLERLFSGAPQYFARSEGHFTGAPHPSVAFLWDEELAIRDLTDHVQIEDKAWGCVTAWPHITRDVQGDWSAAKRAEERAERTTRAHFYPRCREKPNMLSMAGLEKGSVGYQAALELAVADALLDEQWGFESLASRPVAVVEQRQRMLASKDGLRHLDETQILELLVKNGKRYTEKHPREWRVASDLYSELFMHVLHPPARAQDYIDPYSLSVQIQALVKVLSTPNAWIDFSHVEWRIRLGRLLWGSPEDDELDDGVGSNGGSGVQATEVQEERYWLLLQILLACELLIRLDAITEGDELGMETIRPSEVHKFEKDATPPVKWAMNLARSWLENIEVFKNEPTQHRLSVKPSGWLATLTKRMSLIHDKDSHAQPTYAIRGKYCQRQVDGLKHFARTLKWPEMDSYSSRITENCRAVTEGTPMPTPLSTPSATSTAESYMRSSYFGSYRGDSSAKRPPSRRRKIAASLHSSGWLSKSYVSGLVLPGEGLSHFLMATLLENDDEAMSKLGPVANLCAGFAYGGKSFWSTSCVVGRVLAAGKGAAECMGWISSDVTPEGREDGWVDIAAAAVPGDMQFVNKKARLWGKLNIEKESGVLGDADRSSVLPADFIIPFENIYKVPPPGLRIDLLDLKFGPPIESAQSTPAVDALPTSTPTPMTGSSQQVPEIKTYPASVSFAVANDSDEETYDTAKEVSFSLSHDVYFVTAHPCVPSQHVRIMKSPSSPTIQQVDLNGGSGPGKTASVVGHPLHKYYTYMAIHLSELLEKRELALDDLLANYPTTAHRPTLTPGTRGADSAATARVLVIDCITGFQPLPQEHEIPLSPVVSRSSTQSQPDAISVASFSSVDGVNPGTPTGSIGLGGGGATTAVEPAGKKMHQETRRRQFGSDMEILIRALCAEKGWNALISRRRRGCLACAIREAGALGWRVIIRVD